MKEKLTAVTVKNAKPNDGKPVKLSDGRGLYLLVNKTGKYWRYNYRHEGKQKTLALGVYPEISLQAARKAHTEAHRLVKEGIDPKAAKDSEAAQKQEEQADALNTFEIVAREWFERFSNQWVESHSQRNMRRLEKHVFPWMGDRPLKEIEPPEVLKCLERTAATGALETAHRVKQLIGQVFRYAVANGKAVRDPTPDLKGALPSAKKKKKHFAAITDPVEIGALMRSIESYNGELETRTALVLSAYLFQRPGEMRQMEWSELDLSSNRWIIPAAKMKLRREHIVPLPTQAIELLEDIRPLTGCYRFVFPSMTDKNKPLSSNTVRQAIRRMGYGADTMTAHGFRAMASTNLYELNWYNSDIIEKQLAHQVGNEVRQAYDRSQFLEQRTEMMQRWADYLGELRDGAKVIPIRAAR